MGSPIGKWFQVFAAGKQTDSKGQTSTYTEKDLDTIVSNFEKDAPITIKHPKADPVTEELRWGGLDGLKREGDKLYARIGDMVDGLGTLLSNGMLPQRSVGLSGNGDSLKLNHLALLGITPPAVKDMPALAFSDAEPVRLYSMDGETEGGDEGFINKVVRVTLSALGMLSDTKDMACATDDEKKKKAAYSETEPAKEIEMTEQEKKDLEAKVTTAEAAVVAAKAETEAVKTEFEAAKAKIAEYEAAAVKAEADAKIAEFSAWADAQITAGRLVPADKAAQVAILSGLDAKTEHDFSAPDGSPVKKTALKLYQESVEAGTVKLASGQFAAAGTARKLDGSEAIDAAVKAKIEKEPKLTYSEALSVVLFENPELNQPLK